MSKKVTDPETGQEIEVFTPEELENQKAVAVAAKEKEFNEKLSTVNTELNKLKEKDLNFTNLREAKEKIEKEHEEFKKGVEVKEAERTKADIDGYKKQVFQAFANQDEEVLKKIEFHFGQLKDSDTNDKTKIDELVKAAYKLATGEERSVVHGAAASSAGGVPVKIDGIPAHLIPHAKAMGMSTEEFAKYYVKAKEAGKIK